MEGTAFNRLAYRKDRGNLNGLWKQSVMILKSTYLSDQCVSQVLSTSGRLAISKAGSLTASQAEISQCTGAQVQIQAGFNSSAAISEDAQMQSNVGFVRNATTTRANFFKKESNCKCCYKQVCDWWQFEIFATIILNFIIPRRTNTCPVKHVVARF